MTWTRVFRPFTRSFGLMLNPRVPWKLKLIPLLTLIYILSPIDLIPDVFLGFGQLDDIALIVIGLQLFLSLASKYNLKSNKDKVRRFPDEPMTIEEGVILE